jgi:hypothetical protein
METYGGIGCIGQRFLALGTSQRWVVNFTPLPLYPWGKNPRPHWIGGWVGPRAGLDDMEKWKFLTIPGVEFRPFGCPDCSQSLYRLH